MKENLLISLLLVAGAIFAWIKRKKQFAQATRASTFPSSTGRIDAIEIREDVREDEDDMGRRDRSITWHPRIGYSFQIAGHAFTGQRYSLLEEPVFYSKEKAEAFCERFKTGDECPVYFDPADPKISCLDITLDQRQIDGKTRMIIGFLLAGAVIILFI